MAADGDACCESDPNFAVICAFLEKFGLSCGLANIDFLVLQDMLENSTEVSQELINLHVKLLRKARKSVRSERWEKAIIKFCHTFSSQDAWEIERFGYKKARLSTKLRILKELLEMQFDYNTKFKNDVNKLSAKELRTQPLGRDRTGHIYWYQSDETCQIRVYKEDPDEETWTLVVKNRDDLVSLITELSDGKETVLNEDSNSLESEKPIIDTGQTDSSSNSDAKIDLPPPPCTNFNKETISNEPEFKPASEETELKPTSEKVELKAASEEVELKATSEEAELKPAPEAELKPTSEEAELESAASSSIQQENYLKSDNLVEDNVEVKEDVKKPMLQDQNEKEHVENFELLSSPKSELINFRLKAIDDSVSNVIGPETSSTNGKKLPEITTGVKEKYIRSDASYSHHRKAVESVGFDVVDDGSNYLKRPLAEVEDIQVPSYMKRSRMDRPTLLGNKKKISYSEDEDEAEEEEVSNEIEEPLMLVKGEGSGQDNKGGNSIGDAKFASIVEDEVVEQVIYFYGTGNGYECETGNERDQRESTNSHSSSEPQNDATSGADEPSLNKVDDSNEKSTVIDGMHGAATTKVSTTKSDFQLGTIYDTRTKDQSSSSSSHLTCSNKRSRWDMGKPSVESLSDDNVKVADEGEDDLVKSDHVPKRSMFFFGPGCLAVKPPITLHHKIDEKVQNEEQEKQVENSQELVSNEPDVANKIIFNIGEKIEESMGTIAKNEESASKERGDQMVSEDLKSSKEDKESAMDNNNTSIVSRIERLQQLEVSKNVTNKVNDTNSEKIAKTENNLSLVSSEDNEGEILSSVVLEKDLGKLLDTEESRKASADYCYKLKSTQNKLEISQENSTPSEITCNVETSEENLKHTSFDIKSQDVKSMDKMTLLDNSNRTVPTCSIESVNCKMDSNEPIVVLTTQKVDSIKVAELNLDEHKSKSNKSSTEGDKACCENQHEKLTLDNNDMLKSQQCTLIKEEKKTTGLLSTKNSNNAVESQIPPTRRSSRLTKTSVKITEKKKSQQCGGSLTDELKSGQQKYAGSTSRKENKNCNLEEIEEQIIENEQTLPKKSKSSMTSTDRITRKRIVSSEEIDKKGTSISENVITETNDEPKCVEKKVALLTNEDKLKDNDDRLRGEAIIREVVVKLTNIEKEVLSLKNDGKNDDAAVANLKKLDCNQEVNKLPPTSLTLANFQLDVEDSSTCSVVRITRKRAAQQSIDALRQNQAKNTQPNIEVKEGNNKRPKLRQKRIVNQNLRRSIEEQKSKRHASSSEEENEYENKSVDQKDDSDNKTEEKETTEIVIDKGIDKRRASVRSETSKSDTPPAPTEKKPRKTKRLLLGLEILPETQALIQNEAPIRQSRRIAQIKIKEEAERRKLEEVTLNELKEEQKRKSKKVIDKDYKVEKRKSNKVNVSDEDTTNDAVDADEKKKRKRKRKHWNPNKQFDVFKAWNSSSGSSSSEIEDEEEEIEEDDDQPLIFKSDHEFSPESDLEEGTEIQPLKRARTARKESDAELEEVDDCACQKCGQKDHPEWILLCDSCDSGWHCSCLRPALLVIPEGDWFCPPCQHNTLVKKLESQLLDFDKKMNKREMEIRRKERLAYVGISLDNVLPSKENDEYHHRPHHRSRQHQEENNHEEEDDDKDADASQMGSGAVSDESESDDESESSASSSLESDSDEPVYQLRERRQAHSYRFNDYDDLINSAIQDELEAVKGAGNRGRGKDIATIVNAEREDAVEMAGKDLIEGVTEKRISEQHFRGDAETTIQTHSDQLESLPPVVPKYEENTAQHSEEETIRRPIKKIISKKKHRKLNSLDVSSEDDAESDEDFRGSSSLESEDNEEEFSVSESSDGIDSRRGKRRKDFGPVRRSTRARISRYDKDFINDESDSTEDAPRRKKTKSLWDESESEESDRSWGNRNSRRKPKKSRKKKTSLDKPKKAKKKKKRVGDDSDPEVYRKRPNIKFGGLNDEEDVGRRTRGKKINYLEALGTDSEDEVRRKPPRIEESEEEYIVHEDEDFKHQLENERDSDESGVDTVIQDIAKLPPQKPKSRGRGKAGLKIPRKPKVPPEADIFAPTGDDLFSPCPGIMSEVIYDHRQSKPIYEQQPPAEVYHQSDAEPNSDIYSAVVAPPSIQYVSSHSVDMYSSPHSDAFHGAITPTVYPVSSLVVNQPLMDQPLNYTSHDSHDLDDEPNPIEQINKNVEQMNEQEMEKMMEEEDYATKQLQLVGLQIEKEKRRKEREAQRLEQALQVDQKLPKKRGRKPKGGCIGEINYNDSPSMIIPSNNSELSEPPGISLPMFNEIGSAALNSDGTPRKRRGRGKGKKTLAAEAAAAAAASTKDGTEVDGGLESSNSNAVSPAPDSPMHTSKLGIAAPPQPFSQSQPTPSVITRMLQSSPGSTFPSQYFSGATGSSGPRGPPPIASNYQQSHYPIVRGTGPPHGMHNVALTSSLPPMYHRSMDPSPSGGAAITVSVSNNRDQQHSPAVVSPSSSSPLSKGEPTPPPPPYSRAQVGHFPAAVTANNTSNLSTVPVSRQQHVSMMSTHLQQQQHHRNTNPPPPSSSPYHSTPPPSMPPNYHYSAYPPPHVPPPHAEGNSTSPVYSGAPPYSEPYLNDASIVVAQAAENNSKGFEDDTGGEFVGLVSYFSSQREDDLDT